MRGIITYVSVSILVLLAIGFVVPASWLGLPAGARAAVGPGVALQDVNRSGKGNRLPIPMTVAGKSGAPVMEKQSDSSRPVKILEGCDPVFSPLSSSAQANLPGRCAV